jgi:hypothetical protein
VAKDGKKKNKGAKSSGGKIPKEVAGVKVPKELRRLGKKAVKAAKSPAVNEIVAGALLSAAASLRQPVRPGKAPHLADRAGDGPGDDMSGAGGSGGPRSSSSGGGGRGRKSAALGDALRAIAFDFARRALDGIEESKKAKRQAAAGAPPQPSAGPATNGSGGGEDRQAGLAPAPKASPRASRRG